MQLKAIEQALLKRFPRATAEKWDRVGLMVGSPMSSIDRVGVALDASVFSIDAAVHADCQLLITHHPLTLDLPSPIAPTHSGSGAGGAALWAAISQNLSVIALHTNLDRSLEARRLMAQLFSTQPQSSLEYPDQPDLAGYGSLFCIPSQTLKTFAQMALKTFGGAPQVWGRLDAKIQRVAVLSGSAGSLAHLAVEADADVLVCGECGYHVCQDLVAQGLGVVLLGHDYSEEPYLEILRSTLVDIGMLASNIVTINGPQQWTTITE